MLNFKFVIIVLFTLILIGCGDERPDPIEVNPSDPVCKTEELEQSTISGGSGAWEIVDLQNPGDCCDNYVVKIKAVNAEGAQRWLVRISADTTGDGNHDISGLEWFREDPGSSRISFPGRVTDLHSNSSRFEVNGVPCGGELLLEFMTQRDDGSGSTRTNHSKRITIRCSNDECDDKDNMVIEDVKEFVAEPEFEPTSDVMERIEFQSTLDFSELIEEIKE